jgi:hypothetical protein
LSRDFDQLRPANLCTAGVVFFIGLSTALSGSCYRPPAGAIPHGSESELARLAFAALADKKGTVIVLDPRRGRVLKRVGSDTDLQFVSSPFELAQIVTAYAALDTGKITDKTMLPCDDTGTQVDVVGALSKSCPAFFAELSRRLSPADFTREAAAIGFVYYGIESGDGTAVRPIAANIPQVSRDAFSSLAVHGKGMEARDLHFVQLVSSLSTGTTASERFAAYIATTTQGPAPPTTRLNQAAVSVIQRALAKEMEEKGGKRISGKSVEGDGKAISISYSAGDPEMGLVVYLRQGTARDASDVALRFYHSYFGK